MQAPISSERGRGDQCLMIDTTDISAYGCYRRACFARKHAGHRGSHLLLYALLELRYCVERYLFETLDTIRMGNLSKAEAKLWGAKGLKQAILKVEPDFVIKLKFVNLLRRAHAPLRDAGLTSGDLPIPDLEQLEGIYGSVGNFLHAPSPTGKIIMDVEWWKRLDEVAVEGLRHMEKLVHAPYVQFNMNEAGLLLFADFKSGRLSEEETLRELWAGCSPKSSARSM
jgi:hypothetical protein